VGFEPVKKLRKQSLPINVLRKRALKAHFGNLGQAWINISCKGKDP
jgi:hypothetical protein